MKRIILAITLALSLGGCAAELAKLKAVYSIVTEATVSPQYILVAGNAFDALEAGATQYLIYCKTNLSAATCSADNRRNVIKYTRSGRAARNQLEPYVTAGTAGPSAIYNTLIAAVNALNASPAAGFGATK